MFYEIRGYFQSDSFSSKFTSVFSPDKSTFDEKGEMRKIRLEWYTRRCRALSTEPKTKASFLAPPPSENRRSANPA